MTDGEETRGVAETAATDGGELRYRRPAVRPLTPVAPLDTSGSFLFGADVQTPRRDSWRRRSLALADVLALVLAWGLMWLTVPPESTTVWEDLVLLPVLPLWIVLNKVLGLYDRDASLVHRSTLNELPTIVHSITLGAALIYLVGPLLVPLEMEREPVVAWCVFALVLAPLLRHGARDLVRRGFDPERVLIIGSGHVASVVAEKIGKHPEYGAELVGYVDVPHDAESNPRGVGDLERLGDVAEFEDVCREYDVERVVIAFSNLDHEGLLDLIRMGKRLRLKVSIVPRLFEVIGHGVAIDQIEGMTLLGLQSLQLSRSTLLLKRGMDIAGAAVGLLLLAPLLLVVAVAVKLDSKGPVLFGQRRIGREGEFRMWKFRSMVDGADAMKDEVAHLNEMADGPMFKITEDPRVTRVGRFLRRTSIDELPQLVNVLRGDMSLVGPRPLIPAEDDAVIGWHRARLDLTPGLTGPWQVLGRNRIPFHEMVKLDYLYVAEWSLWNDVKLIVRTLPVVFRRGGA